MTGHAPCRILLIGYGNPGRLDDGLGPALAAEMEKRRIPGLSIDADYQLSIENAAEAAGYEVAIFADAAIRGPEPFEFRSLEPSQGTSGVSSHSVEPGEVLALARKVFSANTRAYVLAIRGYEFDAFGERLSPRAQGNLAAAASFLEAAIREGDLDKSAAADTMKREGGKS